MTRTVWLRADDAVGDWERRKRRLTAGLEAGVDWVLVDGEDVARVQELGDVNVAAFRPATGDAVDGGVAGDGGDGGNEGADGGDEDADGGDQDADNAGVDAEADEGDAVPDAWVVGKGAEGDGTVDLPDDLAGSADLTTLRRDDRTAGAYVRILGEAYEALAEAAAAHADYTLVAGEDWTVIPLENLIARIGEETTLVAGVEGPDEARTAFETLELGADGVLLDAADPDDVRETVAVRDAADRETLDLVAAEVTAVERTGSADRVCVDTGSLLSDDEGMLVGSMSRGLFFVHAETAESPYVAARPFRVNAGAVHAYVRVPGGETRYLSELESGDDVLVVDRDGGTREAVVGRAKIEKRPMFRVEAEVDTDGGPDRVETLLQNAETVKVATPGGRTAVTDLEPGDEVVVHYDPGGRHFGESVEESVVEK